MAAVTPEQFKMNIRKRDTEMIDKKSLKSYRSRKIRISKLKSDIKELQTKDIPIVKGTVQSSMQDFPYLRCKTDVDMYEPVKNDNLIEKIQRKSAEIDRLEELNRRVDEYIESLEDVVIKNVLECYYIDGTEKVTQKEVADRLGITDRSTISKIINNE